MHIVIIFYFLVQTFSVCYSCYLLKDELSTVVKLLVLSVLVVLSFIYVHKKNPGFVEFETLNLIEEVERNGGQSYSSDKKQQDNSNSFETLKVYRQKEDLQIKVCTLCKENRLIRMKHCHQCRICVATFDHHCTWLDNCIGEKNRPFFLIFLILQLSQVLYAFISLIADMIENGILEKRQISFLTFIGILIIISGSLLFFHLYLMCTNKTTWETLKWESVFYLKGVARKDGSPFSEGILINIKQYWGNAFKKELKVWEFKK